MDIYKIVPAEKVIPKTRQQLIDKAMKLKALADEGYKGEQDTAANLLAEMMQKYDITWSDLDDSVEREYVFPCEGEYHKRLLIQITYMHLGAGHCYRMFTTEDKDEEFNSIKVKCRPRDFLEIKLDWEFYWLKLQEEFDLFYRAFVEKNHLFPSKDLEREDNTNDNENLSEKAVEKLICMMSGIDEYTRHLGIESPEEDNNV